jgi:hypothetical protein
MCIPRIFLEGGLRCFEMPISSSYCLYLASMASHHAMAADFCQPLQNAAAKLATAATHIYATTVNSGTEPLDKKIQSLIHPNKVLAKQLSFEDILSWRRHPVVSRSDWHPLESPTATTGWLRHVKRPRLRLWIAPRS